MLKTRLIPVLLLRNGLLVRSELFSIHQIIGNPINEVKRFNEWNVDELVYLDISAGDSYDTGREDHRVGSLSDPLSILEAVGKNCFMPLTWGGRIRSIEDMRNCFVRGADKISINSAAVANPRLIADGADTFGRQAIVVSIDVKRSADGRCEVYTEGGRTATGYDAVEWAARAESLGAGEILLQSIDRDGTGSGYDVELVSEVSRALTIPVIACSGVGMYEHYAAGVRAGAAAVAAANIWHFRELSDRNGKRAMARAGIPVRL